MDITLDGRIIVTGTQIGYDFETLLAKKQCFVMKLNYDLSTIFVKSFTTESSDVTCESVKTTRHGDNIYIQGWEEEGANKYLVFWHMLGAAFTIHKANVITLPAGESLRFRRMMLTQNQVYNRPAGQADRFNDGKIFFCGNLI